MEANAYLDNDRAAVARLEGLCLDLRLDRALVLRRRWRVVRLENDRQRITAALSLGNGRSVGESEEERRDKQTRHGNLDIWGWKKSVVEQGTITGFPGFVKIFIFALYFLHYAK